MYTGEHRRQARHRKIRKGRTRPRLAILVAAAVIAISSLSATSANASTQGFHLYYRVKPGDTLSMLAGYFCHNPARYPSIARASGISNPNVIRVGQRLTINCSGSTARARSTVRRTLTRVGYHTHYSYSGLKSLWRGAGGPSWAAPRAARIAICESGGYIYAHNPSGATGLWQILGNPFPGNAYNPFTNARMAVVKFHGAGNSFAPWVCRG